MAERGRQRAVVIELRRVARLVRPILRGGCDRCGLRLDKRPGQRFCSAACASWYGGRPKTPPRVCTGCAAEWRPSGTPESRASALCWECRKPAPSGNYRSVKEGLKKRLVLREGGRCQDCGATAEGVGEPLHAHHVVPQALGGSNTLDNLRLLCPDCHLGSGYERHHSLLLMAGLVRPGQVPRAA